MIYYILFVCIIISGFAQYAKMSDKAKRIIMLYLPMLFFVLVAGLRAINVGIDTYNYSLIFYNQTWRNIFSSSSIIYNIYSCVIKEIFNSYMVFNLINAIIINYSVARFVGKYSDNQTISYVCYLAMGVYFNTMNQCREYMAIAILLWATDAVIEKKNLKFVLFSLMAIFVHNISIVLVVALIVARFVKRIKWRHLLLSILLLYIFVKNYDYFIEIFTEIFSSYRVYLEEWVGLYNGGLGTSRIIYMAIISSMLCVMLMIILKKREKDRVEVLYVILMFADIVFLLLSKYVHLFLRIAFLFDAYVIVFIPRVLRYFKQSRIITIIMYAILLIYMTLLLRSDGSGVLPYQFYWS